ncbi:uncharacterized protein BDR25DRAFT_379525 [Lindgomyces ingoldianus]|uniref:Uncharacterized protein n=1 Tax=Lindgomyces ingoldianus TaxID=673940 RepID=A0ACB6RA02_9PLEO|nr:uncharacterized protein BDR25DRAFT_379525 [Lindgomyces ingoldianus]KAF2475922.1 hypothetical protein BDR25DRAFT_379525 [Lindgomyces ingoldianus]
MGVSTRSQSGLKRKREEQEKQDNNFDYQNERLIDENRRLYRRLHTQAREHEEIEQAYKRQVARLTNANESNARTLNAKLEDLKRNFRGYEETARSLRSQLDEKTDSLQRTKLDLNRHRMELSNATRRASKAEQENTVKNQQMEFMIQQYLQLRGPLAGCSAYFRKSNAILEERIVALSKLTNRVSEPWDHVRINHYLGRPEHSLHHAAATGDVKECWRLLCEGVKVDSHNNRGRSPLAYAVAHGQLGATILLVEAGADLHKEGIPFLDRPKDITFLAVFMKSSLQYTGELADMYEAIAEYLRAETGVLRKFMTPGKGLKGFNFWLLANSSRLLSGYHYPGPNESNKLSEESEKGSCSWLN